MQSHSNNNSSCSIKYKHKITRGNSVRKRPTAKSNKIDVVQSAGGSNLQAAIGPTNDNNEIDYTTIENSKRAKDWYIHVTHTTKTVRATAMAPGWSDSGSRAKYIAKIYTPSKQSRHTKDTLRGIHMYIHTLHIHIHSQTRTLNENLQRRIHINRSKHHPPSLIAIKTYIYIYTNAR